MTRKKRVVSGESMSVMGHVQELQIRLVVSAVFLIAGAALAYVFRDELIHILLAPLGGQSLMYLNPAGGFSFILLVSVYAGLALAAPVTIYQIFCFIRPVLSMSAQKKSLLVLLSSLVLLAGGVVFGYVFAIPGALNFLYEFAGDYVQASLTADSYLNFVVAYTLGLGLVFQLPILLMLVHWIHPLTPSKLFKSERWVVLAAFLAAAVITPTPDPLNQTIIALPIIFIYQVGVIAVLISVSREKRHTAKAESKQQLAEGEVPARNLGVATPSTGAMQAVARQSIRQNSLSTGLALDMTVAVPKNINTPSSKQGAFVAKKNISTDGFIAVKKQAVNMQPHKIQRIDSFKPARSPQYSNRKLSVGPRSQITSVAASGKYIDGVSRAVVA